MTTTAVDFVKLSPTQNMTLLVTSRHPVREYRSTAAQLLFAGHVHAEQVGLIRTPTSTEAQVRLHMAGDEACGNACMALAALMAAEQDLGIDDRTDVALEASGADAFVTCRVERHDLDYDCHLTMPRPSRVVPCSFRAPRPADPLWSGTRIRCTSWSSVRGTTR